MLQNGNRAQHWSKLPGEGQAVGKHTGAHLHDGREIRGPFGWARLFPLHPLVFVNPLGAANKFRRGLLNSLRVRGSHRLNKSMGAPSFLILHKIFALRETLPSRDLCKRLRVCPAS
jgi:hypothetical protein